MKEPVEADMLLCDAAQAVNGKLYIIGGGWNVLRAGRIVPMALAIRFSVPWSLTNKKMKLVARLRNQDGGIVTQNDQQIETHGDLEVGRPVGTSPGSPLAVPIALNISPLSLEPGAYYWQIEIDGEEVRRCSFEVR